MLSQVKKNWALRKTAEYRLLKQQMVGGVFAVMVLVCLIAYMTMEEKEYEVDDAFTMGRKLLGFPARDGEQVFGRKALQSGAVLLHIIGMFYMFLAIAIICDEYFVPAIDVLVAKLKMSPDAAGATFMAAGGSAPELFTSFIGVWITKDDVGLGTIVGSAVFNVLFVIGCCAIFSLAPLKLTWWPFFRDCSFYSMSLITLAAFFTLSSPNKIVWYEALILFFMYTLYVTMMFYNEELFKWVNGTVLKRANTVKIDGEDVEDTSALQVARPLNFTVSIFSLMTADATIEDLAGIHIVSRMKGDAQATFNSIDQDGNGTIDKQEFRSCLKRLGRHVTDAEVAECFGLIDTDKSGTIDFKEFSHWYVTSQWKIKQDVEHIFNRFDNDEDGMIDTDEIFDLLKAVNPSETPAIEQVEEAKKILDSNNDGHVSLAEFLKWWETSAFFERELKRRGTVADLEEKEEEDGEGIKLTFPENTTGRIFFIISLPLVLPMYYSVPNVRRSEWWAQFYGVTLAMSMVWLAIYSTLMVFFANVFGAVAGIPPAVMGLTLLAAGTSVPDLLTSVIVARAGKGDMAVSSSIGSNIFDILVGLPIPWLSWAFIMGKPIEVNSKGVGLSIFVLFIMILCVLAIIVYSKWIMTNTLGYTMFFLYFVFMIQDLARVYA